jgi:tetratricopeptide (TPR) repeat protein
LSPSEDYYYLFLARAALENARSLNDKQTRDVFISRAEKDMLRAQSLNPLNTDHTANLARLYSVWAELTEDPQSRRKMIEQASSFYASAVNLSPNNSRLWGEWALLLFSQVNDFDAAEDKIAQAISLDPNYDWTHSLAGEFYFQKAENLELTVEEQKNMYEKALAEYSKGLALNNTNDLQTRYRTLLSIARTHSRLGHIAESIEAYQTALSMNPTDTNAWRIEEILANLFLQVNNPEEALFYAQKSLDSAPDDQKERLQTLITKIEENP